VQSLIIETFDVSEAAAQDYAAELVALAEGWGSQEKAAALDWTYRIRKDLGAKLQWRSEVDHRKFDEAQHQNHQAYEFLIRGRNRF
jgi:hypothetical protein